MMRILRPMLAEGDGLPRKGKGSKLLGIRESDVRLEEDGYIKLKSGGLSIATSISGLLNLPIYLTPFDPFGKLDEKQHSIFADKNFFLFQVKPKNDSAFWVGKPVAKGVVLRSKGHAKELGYLGPISSMNLNEFRSAIEATRPQWEIVDWQQAEKILEEAPQDGF